MSSLPVVDTRISDSLDLPEHPPFELKVQALRMLEEFAKLNELKAQREGTPMKCYGGTLDFLVVWKDGKWRLVVDGQEVGDGFATCGEAFARAREMETAPASMAHDVDTLAVLGEIMDKAGYQR